MDVVDFLLTRQSNPHLGAPAPSNDDLLNILKAGNRVPDHAALLPWHFHVFTGQGLNKLSEVFLSALPADTEQAKRDKTEKMPFRAPMIIAVSSKTTPHPKVPNVEQVISAGCAVHAMQMMATALGYGAMWRTGDFAFSDIVKQKLSIDTNEEIVGFLYIGTPSKTLPQKPEKSLAGKVTYFR
ncbi:NAD(P)H nitroreductase [Thalassotalea agarivorans]|uniref:Putative NAD(P)H nitroreductase n=1 Tax=Thalassotalea agarivorans TaxID=349064 RepID=A0A1I0EXU3_THASX|nr:NAD(P)H nitroreductase [Thalassotalea agarivorans]SET50329.1 Nitroreductase [Thalassotalea agarivorans]